MKPLAGMRIVTVLVAAGVLFACGGGKGGGGGGAGGGGGGGGGGSGAVTFSVQVTDIDLMNTQRNAPVDANGLPVNGATVTRN